MSRLRDDILIQTSNTFRVDNRDALASVQVHKVLIYNGQYEICRQTRSPNNKTVAPQSQRCDASTNDAQDGALRANTEPGANPRASLCYR
jgi:hypothetical protein